MENKRFFDHVLGYWGYQRLTAAAATTNNAFATGDSADVPIGSKQWDRTLSSTNVQRLNKDSWIAYRTNPIYQSIVEMVVSMIVGNEAKAVVNDLKEKTGAELVAAERLQAHLDSHWNDPRNDWTNLLPDVGRDFLLFGEIIPIPSVNTMTGEVYWGFIPPESIKKLIRDPLNVRRVIAIVVQDDTGQELTLPIIKTDDAGTARATDKMYENAQNLTAGRLTGRCMYWAINRALTSARGTGDFVQLIRPAKDAVKLVSSVADRARINNKTVADIKFPTNWTQTQINAALDPSDKDNYIHPPRVDNEEPQLFGHSADLEFKFATPQIGAGENAEVFTMLKAVVCVAAHNAPEHLVFGQGQNSNRATAAEMGAPFYEYLNARQTTIISCITDAVNFTIDQKLIFTNELDGLSPEQLADWTLHIPKVNMENVLEQLDALGKKLGAITAAKVAGDLTPEETAAMTRDAMSEHGFKVEESKNVK